MSNRIRRIVNAETMNSLVIHDSSPADVHTSSQSKPSSQRKPALFLALHNGIRHSVIAVP